MLSRPLTGIVSIQPPALFRCDSVIGELQIAIVSAGGAAFVAVDDFQQIPM